MRRKIRRLREEAYEEARNGFAELVKEPTFCDFICMYIGEGFKRSRGTASICNSDPMVMILSTAWLRRLTTKKLFFALQYHCDQDPEALRVLWAAQLKIAPADIRLMRKSNSGRLTGRTWRSRYGVLTVGAFDTLLRARLQAWMDCVQERWLDSLGRGVAQPGSAQPLGG